MVHGPWPRGYPSWPGLSPRSGKFWHCIDMELTKNFKKWDGDGSGCLDEKELMLLWMWCTGCEAPWFGFGRRLEGSSKEEDTAGRQLEELTGYEVGLQNEIGDVLAAIMTTKSFDVSIVQGEKLYIDIFSKENGYDEFAYSRAMEKSLFLKEPEPPSRKPPRS